MFTLKRLAAGLTLLASFSFPAALAQADPLPPIAPLKPMEVKWILPPDTSEFYWLDKAFAEGAGYDTVENRKP